MKLRNWVKIDTGSVVVNGNQLQTEPCGAGRLLHSVYKDKIGNYPKFHKMDPLCKLGFVASELLLDVEARSGARVEEWCFSIQAVL